KYRKYIRNTLETSYTNGALEGMNNFIKSVKRVAFGFRKFSHFRQRIFNYTRNCANQSQFLNNFFNFINIYLGSSGSFCVSQNLRYDFIFSDRKKDFKDFVSKIPKILLKISYFTLHQHDLTKNLLYNPKKT
ncbi:hypothetical protein HMPREF9466_01903, partial [Fusobacterium necrophorum subsp. funduliforme 1_1_36S]